MSSIASLQASIELLGNPVVVTRGAIVVAANQAFLTALGFERSAVLGQNYQKFVSPEEFKSIDERIRRRQSEGAFPTVTMRANALDARGTRRPWLIYVTTVKVPGDDVPHTMSSCSEIPEAARDFTLAERVVQLAAALAVMQTEDEVRTGVVTGFGDFGIKASLSVVHADGSLAVLCTTEGAPAPSPQIFREARESHRPIFVLPPETKTFTVYIPILRTDAPAELLVLWSSPFETLHLSLLTLFARQLAATLEGLRRMAELGRRNTELSLMLDLARTTAATLDVAVILDVACDFIVRLLDVSNCFILLLDDEGKTLKAVASSAAHRHFFRNVVIDMKSDSIAARAIHARAPVMIEDTRAQGLVVRRDLVDRFGEKALLAVPMTARSEPIGAFVVDDTRAPRHFSASTVSLAEATASQLALSVQNAQLYESLKVSYAQLAATRAEMVKQERLAALGELSAIVAHEVRNPLGVIFNAVASLRRATTADPDAAMLLEMVKEECERLNRIVSDLLDFSRPAGLLLELEDLEVLLTDSIAAALAGTGMEAQWRVDTEISPALPRIPVDRQALRQALMNVIINALQSMPKGGRLQVRAAKDGAGSVRIDISDDGPGISSETRARIFEPFFTTKAKGTGLGLAVVKRILEDHHGEVLLVSEPGAGTTFTFKLPLHSGGLSAAEDKAS